MNTDELIISVVLAGMVAVIILARKLNIAYPILLLLAGLLIGFVPGAPKLEIDPEVILLGALPPLLFYHSFLTSSREIKRNAGAIVTLSVGLVVVTAGVVAALAYFAFGLPLAVSIALGAIVGPTDPVAFLTVARRLGISPRIVGLLDGENLVNDTAAIVLYALAVEYITTDSFDFASAAFLFLAGSAGGVAWGYLVGRAAAAINSRIEDPATAPVIVLFAAYLAFIPAEAAHISAVLAAVTAGRVIGARSPVVDRPGTRISGYGFWDAFAFLVTAGLFVVMGLQLPVIAAALPADMRTTLLFQGLLVATAVVLLRLIVVFAMVGLSTSVATRLRPDGKRPWPEAAVIGWSGMRGGVSLTLALALPLSTAAGEFAERTQLMLIVYAVLLVTLVGQGLTMPIVVGRVKLHPDVFTPQERELAEASARKSALARLQELLSTGRITELVANTVRRQYEERTPSAEATLRDVHYSLIEAERVALLQLRRRGEIGDEVLRELEHKLDLRFEAESDQRHD